MENQASDQTALENEVEFLEWAYQTLGEINPSNYDHSDVCELNSKSVEVIQAIASRMKAFGVSPEASK